MPVAGGRAASAASAGKVENGNAVDSALPAAAVKCRLLVLIAMSSAFLLLNIQYWMPFVHAVAFDDPFGDGATVGLSGLPTNIPSVSIPEGIDESRRFEVVMLYNPDLVLATIEGIYATQVPQKVYAGGSPSLNRLEVVGPGGIVLWGVFLDLDAGVNVIHLPYFRNAMGLRVLRDSVLVSQVSLAVFVPFCSNGLCDEGESLSSCPADCAGVGAGVECVADGVCAHGCADDPDCAPARESAALVPSLSSPAPILSPAFSVSPAPGVSGDSRGAVSSSGSSGSSSGSFISMWFFVGAVLVVAALIVFLIMSGVLVRRQDPSLRQWVIRQLHKGKALPQIRSELLLSGYPEKIVDKVLDDVLR